jgi:predicted Na+-dependent transporter
VTAAVLLILKLGVAALIFATGLYATLKDLSYLWRRPVLCLKSLLAMYFVVPLLAFLAIRYLDLPRPVDIALFVLAVSAGAALLPRKLISLGNPEYVFSLVVTSSLLAIVMAPAWLHLIHSYVDNPPELMPGEAAVAIGRLFLLPLVMGMLIRWIVGPKVESAARLMMKAVGAVFALAALLLLLTNLALVAKVGWIGFLSLAVFSLVSLAVGHALGGPQDADRTALAIACSTRHVGLAIVIASAAPTPTTTAFVITYLLASAAVSLPYLKLRSNAPPSEG